MESLPNDSAATLKSVHRRCYDHAVNIETNWRKDLYHKCKINAKFVEENDLNSCISNTEVLNILRDS